MNPRELVDHIRSGPAKVVLDKPLRFNRQTCSNPCDFTEFLQALQSSETIRHVVSYTPQQLGITEDEWLLLIETLGSIKGIENLTMWCVPGSRDFHPFQAVADAVNNARSLCKLVIGLDGETFPRDPSGLIALAGALREHTVLQEFSSFDFGSRGEAAHINAFDPVLRALPACPHLRQVYIKTKHASADALKNLLQLQSAIHLRLVLKTDHWVVVADEIRQGRCNVRRLTLSRLRGAISKATEAVQALAGAIQMDRNLEHITLRMENGFTNEAGIALAEALTVNKTLRKIKLYTDVRLPLQQVHNQATLGVKAYEAFSAMLRVNTNLVLKLPPFETAGADEMLRESHDQLRIEQRLNNVGRGRLLASRQMTGGQWVDALHELNSGNVDDSPAFRVSCLYSLLRLHPAVLCMS
jgi:hypothetical protein